LVIEDDPRVAASVERALRAHGYAVSLASDAASGMAAIRAEPDLVVLDVNLPDGSGFDVCRRARRDGISTPILMLTARAAVEDRVEGLDAGADDYLVKPFALAELLARVRALVRRQLGDANGAGVIEFADVRIDLGEMTARRGERLLDLTRTEMLLLELFLRNPTRVLSREQILDRVWGVDARTSANGVEVYVGYLRRKLEAGGEPRLLQTVRGFGYALRP
jgi:two-component system, OmpR family, response regulator MprA